MYNLYVYELSKLKNGSKYREKFISAVQKNLKKII